MSSNELYNLYKDAGPVPTEIVINGIITVICFSGIILNMLLVNVTVKSKTLHSTCNILIALYAFSISFILIGNSVPFFVFIFGINFISLQLCFYIQIIPLIFTALAILLQLCIGIDRLFAVSFPIWYQMGGRFKLFKIFIAICCAKTVLVNISYYYGSSKHWEKPVMCTIGDPAHQPETNSMSTILSLITYCADFICYVLIWLVNYFRNGHHGQSFTESERNKRLLISLSVIMSIGLICYIGTCVFLNGVTPLLSLNIFTFEYIVWPICNCLASMAYSSCTPVLFLCSTEYRKAFCKYLCKSEHRSNVVVPLRNMRVSDIPF
ncbi:hypothetical protein niasHS_016460 [Heterodera schachtii]|uniref:G-protein coupled receptors family 1 profile domain-containing protein n=1 Tax=Heterodera schachtii TaxID=97005 RepID=A0ABD2HSP8_HETSC